MKESRYNFFFKVDEDKFIFNSLTCAFAKLDDEFEENFKRVLNGEEIESELLNDMKNSGVIVEDCFDELEYLKMKHFSGKFGGSHLGITIAPTMMCNFACPYCYENPKPLLMKDEVMDAIVERVKKASEAKRSVSIVWYGGEPLLAKNIIWNLSERMMAVCKENGVDYKARMISNGYLVDDQVIENMIAYKINRIQGGVQTKS